MITELEISLPPGPIASVRLREFLETALGADGWIKPTSFGSGEPDEVPLPPGTDVLSKLEACMRDEGNVVFQQKGAGYVNVKPDRYHLSFGGAIYIAGNWKTLISRIADQPETLGALMARLGAPVAVCASEKAIDAFSQRWVDQEDGSSRSAATVLSGYDRGLEHPHWRIWFGREWTEFLGREVLARAPALESRPLGQGWFVQIHQRAEDWDKPAGVEQAGRFAAALGKPVFYDPAAPDRPLVAPDFSHLMAAARAAHPELKPVVIP